MLGVKSFFRCSQRMKNFHCENSLPRFLLAAAILILSISIIFIPSFSVAQPRSAYQADINAYNDLINRFNQLSAYLGTLPDFNSALEATNDFTSLATTLYGGCMAGSYARKDTQTEVQHKQFCGKFMALAFEANNKFMLYNLLKD